MNLPDLGVDVPTFLIDSASFVGPIIGAMLGVSLALDVVAGGVAWAKHALFTSHS